MVATQAGSEIWIETDAPQPADFPPNTSYSSTCTNSSEGTRSMAPTLPRPKNPIYSKYHTPAQYFPTVEWSPSSPLEIQQCTEVLINYAGLMSPYSSLSTKFQIFIIPSSQASILEVQNATVWDTLPLQFETEGHFTWNVDPEIDVGSGIAAAIRDVSGTWSFSSERTVVANGQGKHCAPNNYRWDRSQEIWDIIDTIAVDLLLAVLLSFLALVVFILCKVRFEEWKTHRQKKLARVQERNVADEHPTANELGHGQEGEEEEEEEEEMPELRYTSSKLPPYNA